MLKTQKCKIYHIFQTVGQKMLIRNLDSNM